MWGVMRTNRPENAPPDPRPDELDRLLAGASPLRPDHASDLESMRGFDDLFDRIVGERDAASPTPPAHKRRPARRTIAGIALAATLVAGGATAAAAGWTSVHTGTFGHRGDTEDTPGRELLNLAGDDMPQVALHLAKGIPFAPGDDAQAYIPRLRHSGEMQADGIRSTLTMDALCGWYGSWLQANQRGDTAAQARATAILEQAPTWPVVVANDGGGVVTLYRQVAQGARDGEPAVIQQAFTANCTELPRQWATK
jgi:hypothetical protein